MAAERKGSIRGAAVPASQRGPTLGDRVRSARGDAGLTPPRLAGDELTKGFISQIESGLVRPSIRSLQHIASRLGRPLVYFIADEPLTATKRVTFPRLAAEAAAAPQDWPASAPESTAVLTVSPSPPI